MDLSNGEIMSGAFAVLVIVVLAARLIFFTKGAKKGTDGSGKGSFSKPPSGKGPE